MSDKLTAIFDKKSMRPACVLLQALYGGDREVCFMFQDWENQPTDTMVRISASRAEWQQVAEKFGNKKVSRELGGQT